MVHGSFNILTFSQVAQILEGELILLSNDQAVRSIFIDSRKATLAQGSIFFAIKGERHDGHEFISVLYTSGVRQFVIEHPIENVDSLKGSNIIKVSSAVEALQKLASVHRSSFNLPIVGITGSNGKTIIKEWLYQMLSKDKVLVKNPGSYNSQIGVPLSVWQIESHHQFGIFEAGISRPGEMDKLEKIIRPSIGIFTNIGSAHDEGFKSLIEKVKEKLKLFIGTDFLIYCRDHELLANVISQTKIKTLSWGTHQEADVRIAFTGTLCQVDYNNDVHSILLPFPDKASRENCLHCVVLMLKLGYSIPLIQDRINELRSVAMRMELKDGINQCQVIDDTYNNDLGGLTLALQFLTHQQQKQKKRLILSDMLESGLGEEELAKKIASLVHNNNLDDFVGIGPGLAKFQHEFPASSSFFTSTKEFFEHFNFDSLQDEVILVKGARVFAFEKIVNYLQQKVHGTVMEIDIDCLVQNFNFFKSWLKAPTKVMVMVKAFAYGSGSKEIANVLAYHKADYLGVAYADEGVELRKHNIQLPIMVMNPNEGSFDVLLQYGLEPEIYSLRILKALVKTLQGRVCRIHLKLDTGMHRLGFEEGDFDTLIAILKSNTNIDIASIFSHLAGADDPSHDAFTFTQFERFIRSANLISNAVGYKPLYHILNSSGILRLPEMQLDMVRLGIGLYGVDPTNKGFNQLKPVASLKTIISQIKHIKAGDTIGYGRAGTAKEDITIATIAIGYADGYSRAFSKGIGEVLIKGKRARIIGNVCMDMTMVDVSGIEVNEGDEVILFGKELPIQEVAKKIQTIPYEILTNTSERVKRIFVSGGI